VLLRNKLKELRVEVERLKQAPPPAVPAPEPEQIVTRSDEALRRWQEEFSLATLKAAMDEASRNIETRLIKELLLVSCLGAVTLVCPDPPRVHPVDGRGQSRPLIKSDSDEGPIRDAYGCFGCRRCFKLGHGGIQKNKIRDKKAAQRALNTEGRSAGNPAAPSAGRSARGLAKVPPARFFERCPAIS